ncbi:MAG: ATP-binding cassette domain-containing protein [Hyphomicrobiales bacterium]|nr:ATP-binding cassette domain-containing protein [Hyphomicrobiales bacterium]
MSGEAILDAQELSTSFIVKRARRRFELKAVDNVSFQLNRGEILGVVGETGCGKTTVGRSLVGLVRPKSGRVVYDGEDILSLGEKRLRDIRLRIRMVFQDPYASLDPRRSVGDSVAEAGDIHGLFPNRQARAESIDTTLRQVGLDPFFAKRFPHELSGGQRQRVGIARAILPTPEIIIADEPVSALDVSIQAQVLNLLLDLQGSLNLTILFISHDLSVVGQISSRIAVMYLGRIVELAEATALYAAPAHPYTKALIAAVPRADPTRRVSGGGARAELPSRFEVPDGCAFASRCPVKQQRCLTETPRLRSLADGRLVACHFA